MKVRSDWGKTVNGEVMECDEVIFDGAVGRREVSDHPNHWHSRPPPVRS